MQYEYNIHIFTNVALSINIFACIVTDSNPNPVLIIGVKKKKKPLMYQLREEPYANDFRIRCQLKLYYFAK